MRYSISGNSVNEIVKELSSINAINVKTAPIINTAFADLTDEMTKALSGKGLTVKPVGRVHAVQVSTPTDIIGTASYTSGDLLDLLGLNQFKFSTDPPLLGDGYVIGVIDTGIRETHTMIGNSVIYGENFSDGPDGDGYNHGTGVASIIHAVVPNAKILNLKVLDDTGYGQEDNVIMAIQKCIDLYTTDPTLAPNIVNMSLGSPDDDDVNNPLRAACRALIAMGVVIVAAAGNSGSVPGAIMTPACEKDVVAIGSISDSTFAVSTFSSQGPTLGGLVKPDAVFLGEDIIIASSASDTATIAKSGTSFATPLSTGTFVMIMQGVMNAQTFDSSMYVHKNVITSPIVINQMLPAVCTMPTGTPSSQSTDVTKNNTYGYGVPVGSLIYLGAGSSGIDWSSTISLSISMMLLMMMSSMVGKMDVPKVK
jgi:serine protease AprX